MREVNYRSKRNEVNHSKTTTVCRREIINSQLRPGTADNDANAIRNMGMLPQGYVINDYLTEQTHFSLRQMHQIVLSISKECQWQQQWIQISTLGT